MISTDFAPNEGWGDLWTSLKVIFQPLNWRDGKYITQVKRKLKYFFKDSEIIFFLTGRSAIYQLLKALNFSSGSEIIVQGFTCEAVVLPILANNLKPIYADIESQSFSLDDKNLEKLISTKTKAIFIQHSFGLFPSKRNAVLKIAKKKQLICY